MPVHYPSDFSLDKASSRYYSYYQLILSKWRLRKKNVQAGKAVWPDIETYLFPKQNYDIPVFLRELRSFLLHMN